MVRVMVFSPIPAVAPWPPPSGISPDAAAFAACTLSSTSVALVSATADFASSAFTSVVSGKRHKNTQTLSELKNITTEIIFSKIMDEFI